MTNKFYFFRSFAPENGSGMDRLCIGTTTSMSRKLLSLLFVLILGFGQMWGAIASGTYVLCTSTSDLEANAHYIIANGTSGTVKCISNVSNNNNRKTVEATVSSSKITVASNSTIMTFTLGGSSGSWTFYTDNYAGTAGYLASAASGNNNYCRVISTAETATISFSSNKATIALTPHSSRKYLKYNTSDLFACYSSGQNDIYLYKKEAASGYSITYHCNGATSGCPSNASGQTKLPATLPTPSRTGCTFAGWYTNEGLTTAATAGATLSANADLYAKWTCDVTLNRNGVVDNSHTNVALGTTLTSLQGEGDQGGCSAWTFVGWSKSQRAAQNNSDEMTLVTTVDGAGPYYAVYRHTEEGGSDTKTFNFGYTDWGKASSFSGTTYNEVSQSGSGITVTYSRNNSNLYANTTSLRFYQNNTLTFDAGSKTITAISFTGSVGQSDITTNVTTCTNTSSSLSWAGSASSVTFTRTGSSYATLSSATVTFSSDTYYYSTTATCCTELGQINGSVNWTSSTTAVLTWNKLSSQVTSWGNVTYGTSGSTACAVDPNDNTLMRCTISNLACGSEHTFTLHPTLASGVCALDANPTIVSSYTKPTITLNKVGTTNGDFSISGNLTSQCPGEDVTVLLSPSEGYEVDALLIGETDYASSVSNNSYTFEMPSSNVTIHATFKTSAKPSVAVTATEGLTENTLSFGNVEKETDKALTITITGSNLTNDVSWALADTDDESAGMFSINPSSTTIGKSAATSGQDLEITFTPAKAKTYTATLTFSTTGAVADKVITLTGTGVNLYTVTLNAGTGSVSAAGWTAGDGVWTKKQSSYQEELTLPNATIGITGWSFAGWKTSAVSTQTSDAQTFVNTTYTPTSDITLYAVYQKSSGGTTVDELDCGFTTVTSTSYTEWSGKSGSASNAVYAGKTTTNSTQDYLQMKGADAVGIISTTSGGKAKKVTVTWHSNQTSIGDNYVLQVYGKNEAYSATSDLYSNTTQGTNLGSIAATSETELTITGDYEYIGLRGSKSALYFAEIDIEWSTASYSYYSNPSDKVTLTYDANGATAGSAPAAVSNITIGTNQTVAAKPALLAKTGHDFGGWNTQADGKGTNYTAGTGEITMTDNITLYAKWTKHNYTVAVASVDHTTITATPEGSSAIAESANASVAYGTEVTLAKTDDSHFTAEWDVYETGNSSNKVSVSEGKFTVPAFDVTVSATITEDAKRNVKFYSNGAQLGTTQEVYVGEAPANVPTPVYEDCLEGSNSFYGWTTEEWSGAINATTIAGKTVHTGALPNVAEGVGDVEYFAVWTKVTGSSSPLFSWAGGTSSELTALANVSASGLGSDYAEGNAPYRVKFDTEGDYIVITTSAAIGSVAVDVKMLGGSDASDIYVQEAEDTESEFSAVETLAISGAQNTVLNLATTNAFDADSRAVKLLFHKGSNVGVGPITISGITSYSEFRTNCCGLKPVTNVKVGSVTASSVTLTWTAPSSTTGITKLQIVNADNGNVLTDNISASATSGTVTTGLTECVSINLKVVSVGDDCSSNSAVIAAIPQDDAKTVTFDYNEGTGTPANATTPCGETTINLPATPTREGYRFMGWNDGSQTLAVNATTYAPESNVTLTAQWSQLFTITYDLNGGTLSPAPNHDPAIAGESVELVSGTPNKGFMATFTGWRVTYVDGNSDEQVVIVSDGAFTMPAANVTITAQYDEVTGQWIKVTDANTLKAGRYVIIAADEYDYAMSTTQNTNNRGREDITKSGTVITNPSNDVQIFVLETGTVASSWAFKTLNGTADQYIYAASSSANHLKSQGSKSDNSSFALDIANGKATAQGTNTNNVLQYNASGMFSCYASANQQAIAIYQFLDGTFYNVNMPAVAPTGGSVTASPSMAKAGETVTLTYTPSRGYTVQTLTVTGATSGSIAISPALEAGVTEYTFTMPAEAVTIAASFEAIPAVEYSLVTNTANLAVGMKFLIVSHETNGYRAAATRNGEYLYAIEIPDPENNKVAITTEEVVDFVLSDKDGGNWVISSIQGKLSQNSGNISYNGANDKWGISISEGNATLSNSTYTLRYNYNNGSTPRFKTYANATGEIPALYALPIGTTYTVSFNDANGDELKSMTVVKGFTYKISLNDPGDVPTNHTFTNSWTDGTHIYNVGETIEVNGNITLQPRWKVTPQGDAEGKVDASTIESHADVVLDDNETLVVDSEKSLGTITGSMEVNAPLQAEGVHLGVNNTMTINSTVTTPSFSISVRLGSTGKGTNVNVDAENGSIASPIGYVDMELSNDANKAQWHSFTVPFEVDALTGIFDANTGEQLKNEVNYAIMDYDGEIRATGAYGWKKYRGTLQPGTFYLMTIDGNSKVLRFMKKEGSDYIAGNSMQMEYFGDGDEDNMDNGWCGVGNRNMFDGYVHGFVAQVLNATGTAYEPINANAAFSACIPFFIQVTETSSLVMQDSPQQTSNLAPRRMPANGIENITVTFGNEEYTDKLYISASEESLNKYQNGKDLLKMTISNTPDVAQIFGKAYGNKLCMVDAPLVNNQAVYDLSLYVPTSGTYSISCEENENVNIYLTRNGAIIWNLTKSPYTVEMEEGTTEGYGLMLVKRAPQDVEIVSGEASEAGVQKVVINDKVFILRGEKLYDLTGKAVR